MTSTSLDSLLALAPAHLRRATYHAPSGSAETPVRLDANELAFPLPPELRGSLHAVLAAVDVGRYPDAKATALKAALATHLRHELGEAGASSPLDASWLCVGNGSDELISLLCTAFGQLRPGRATASVLYPDPTFVVYRLAALAAGLEPIEVPLERDFTLDPRLVRDACAGRAPNLAFFALPNNPSGTLWPLADVLALTREFPDIIFVADEAYGQYSGQSLLGALAATPNLVIMRTFSKIGLPALRVGYVCAHPELITVLERARMPYNVGALAQAGATWHLRHAMPWVAQRCAEIVLAREALAPALAARGLTVYPSAANFLLCRVALADDHANPALALTQRLAAQGIAIRNLHRPGHLAHCVRITVGTPAENAALLAAL
ncbi:MAG: aminotransferase class I/II-fold pyridoxal phosphate-dependent enzyme [Myxococcales bacterium]|nr:aminotransferase class I/II-fold pyridoxal phosphate-dependent enzyme [Myxococcales bacterium]